MLAAISRYRRSAEWRYHNGEGWPPPGSKNSTSPPCLQKVTSAPPPRSVPKGQIPSALFVFGAAVLLGLALWCECVGRTFQERESALLLRMLYTMMVVRGDEIGRA